MQVSQLPYWIGIMQALGPTIVTAAIGVFAWYIAWQQWRTAEKKRTQDLFEKRFRVFEATRHFLGEIELHGKPSKDALRLYANCIAGAMFLFDDSLSKYLKEIEARAVNWQDNEARADRRPDGDEQRARLVDTASDQNGWFLREASVSVLEVKFKKVSRSTDYYSVPSFRRKAKGMFRWLRRHKNSPNEQVDAAVPAVFCYRFQARLEPKWDAIIKKVFGLATEEEQTAFGAKLRENPNEDRMIGRFSIRLRDCQRALSG